MEDQGHHDGHGGHGGPGADDEVDAEQQRFTNASGNGSNNDADSRERAEEAVTHVGAVNKDGHLHSSSGHAPTRMPLDGMQPRHPETPYTSLPADLPYLFAEEVGDPIAKSKLTAMMGKAASGIPYDKAFGDETGLARAAQAVADVRKGAYEVQSKRDGLSDRALIARTFQDIAALRVEGEADAKKAERVAESIPRIARALEAAREERGVALRERAKALGHRAIVRDEEEERERQRDGDVGHAKSRDRRIKRQLKPRKVAPLLAKVAPPAVAVLAVMLIDAVANMLNLQPAIANGINIDPNLAYLLAGGLSIGVLIAAAAAGLMLAASRLPARLIAFGLVVLFVALMTQFLPGLELMREGQVEGLKSLTTSTTFAAYVAFVVAYAHGVLRDTEDERAVRAQQDESDGRDRELRERAGSRLRDACVELDRAETALAKATAEEEKLETALDAAYAQVELLLDSHARIEGRVAVREGETESAKTRGSVREEILEIQHGQEDHSVTHGVDTAKIWWWITRFETLDPDQTTKRRPAEGSASLDHDGAAAERALVMVAITSLLASAVLGLLLGPVAFAVGGTVAAVALAVTLLRRSKAGKPVPPRLQHERSVNHIGGVISTEDPTWTEMPSRMVPRHRAVDAEPAESHWIRRQRHEL